MSGRVEFRLQAPYGLAGDQPQAVEALERGFRAGERFQTLLGVTGSGKTFTVANLIQRVGRPTLVLTHNKTLAAQLYEEFKAFFPDNAVEYFISYYDYYQPEAYVVASDTFIEKDASVNDEIEKLRLHAATSLLTRPDTIVVASVSCIYGLGSPDEFENAMVPVAVGQRIERDDFLRKLIAVQYRRNDYEAARGCFRVRGDVVDVRPANEDWFLRVGFFGDEIEKISLVDATTGTLIQRLEKTTIVPARPFSARPDDIGRIVSEILRELDERLAVFRAEGKLVEAQRLEERVKRDAEMLKETGFVSGIENYSRIVENRAPGTRPHTLLDFFRDDWFLVVDESHVSVPQVRGMSNGDRQRKQTLVDYGFRLPCALDNRPMNFAEFEAACPDRVLFLSATPGDYELEKSGGVVVEQIIRPTGLLDPEVEVHGTEGQMEHLLEEIRRVRERGERALVTTMTKRMAERLTDFLSEMGEKVRYLHSDVESLERSSILRDLRLGEFDVLVGINLLREGLDLPEVSLVAILDADKEGFLRSHRSLIQTMGRAARNVHGRVVLYADSMTDSMKAAIDETVRRRELQKRFNEEHGIVPKTVAREVSDELSVLKQAREASRANKEARSGRGGGRRGGLRDGKPGRGKSPVFRGPSEAESGEDLWLVEEGEAALTAEEAQERMLAASAKLDFEEAARWRDLMLKLGGARK
ncbi:MAG: excinuclease ABC subunit UvrB [Fibrobacterales bacterium]|nr:excinuclease ABC subunit UvrB [Fibrobacterales bacterium]